MMKAPQTVFIHLHSPGQKQKLEELWVCYTAYIQLDVATTESTSHKELLPVCL